jgi:hypothetical protein
MSNDIYQKVCQKPKECKRLLGVNFEQLTELIGYCKRLHQIRQEEIEKQKKRVIRAGGGLSPKLSLENQIILTLIYLRHYLTFQVLGLMFDVSESTAHNIFTYWQKLLEEGLPASLLEEIKKSPEDGAAILAELTTQELIVDSTEQVIERPTAYQEQKRNYSGKKKNYTLKNQLIVSSKTLDIVDIEVGWPGRVSDITIWRERQSHFAPEQLFIGDKGYVGEAQIKTPIKRPKNGALTSQEKEENKHFSSGRIVVEHLIRLLKIFKIIQERLRLPKSRYDSIFLTVCGLVRLRLGCLELGLVES